jgi:hypothetical protein
VTKSGRGVKSERQHSDQPEGPINAVSHSLLPRGRSVASQTAHVLPNSTHLYDWRSLQTPEPLKLTTPFNSLPTDRHQDRRPVPQKHSTANLYTVLSLCHQTAASATPRSVHKHPCATMPFNMATRFAAIAVPSSPATLSYRRTRTCREGSARPNHSRGS